ncbi:hypothetical protein AB0G04_33475 [Actinoplanes sp. NPDC023801]|uniref:hypothetical protein n=1 Tax=Actinoplanes sp. NPDC023801 TaxID=3154595 RepID=UPI003401EB82
MNRLTSITIAGLAASAAVLTPAAANASAADARHRCTAARPASDFYAGGRIASVPVSDDNAACTTISVSHVRDVRRPADTCQTFLVAILSSDGRDPTYTEPVQACSPNPRVRTVLATGVPAGVQFRVLYQVDYIEPDTQRVRYTVWH